MAALSQSLTVFLFVLWSVISQGANLLMCWLTYCYVLFIVFEKVFLKVIIDLVRLLPGT